jgi:hypothetical protein
LYIFGESQNQTSTKPRSEAVLYLFGSWGPHKGYKSHQVELSANKWGGADVIT